ncbi:MAG: class I SAM-dependent methyltransferase, partial [Pseudomonadota bacterium]|nr:class I SAM-dependent methyltransferase [Pseudomonadota bacterium]
GKHALHVARYFRDVQVTAIDISTASLQYAQAMADRYKLSNIDFLQADILELHQLNQKFDIIECSGVLHHMESPLQGAQQLVGLLKPKGIMKIGLYSERARHSIVQCRNLIREQNIDSTPDGIRQLRREVLSNEHDDWKNIQVSPDFYSASGCRDLLLHVQEHRFTPLQLKELIENLDVNFLGFSNLNNSIIEKYQARFPKDKYLLNLRHWDTYETDHPATFAAMYQFYVQKT